MEHSIFIHILLMLVIAIVAIALLRRLGLPAILAYLLTGVVSGPSGFHWFTQLQMQSVAELGVVLLMFTLGLEFSVPRLWAMRRTVFGLGSAQMIITALVAGGIAMLLGQDVVAAVVIGSAIALSSTAIVLKLLNEQNWLRRRHGELSVSVLLFQDLAVIPILLLMSFLSNNEMSMVDILLKTFLYATAIIVFMFTLGKKIIGWLLHFSSTAKMEELFLSSVFTIVIGASLFAHELGFTYSLGAFIAGMIIAETNFHIKVESDIASYKDLLLGAFFFSIGTKIDIFYFASNLYLVLGILLLVMTIKAIIIYFIIRKNANKSDAIKSALALCQIGEFSFAIFALAVNQNILQSELGNFLILITVLSMLLTPFMINNIYKIASLFVVEFFEADKISPVNISNHTIVCGFAILGRIVAKELTKKEIDFLIISDNLQHVLLARKRGYKAYFGHLDKIPVLESLKVEQSNSIIITVNTLKNKQIICEAVLDYYPQANLIVKVNTLEEKNALSVLNIKAFVHAHHETAMLLVKRS